MAEDIIYKWGEIEILPSRMDKYIKQQEMNEGDASASSTPATSISTGTTGTSPTRC